MCTRASVCVCLGCVRARGVHTYCLLPVSYCCLMAATLNEYEAQNAKSVVRLGTHSVKTLVNSSLAAIEAYAVFSNPFQSKSSLF